MEAWLSIFLGDQVIPTNDTLREGKKKKNGSGRVMLDDVGMHVRNLSFQHGADPAVKSNKLTNLFQFFAENSSIRWIRISMAPVWGQSCSIAKRSKMQCDTLISPQQRASPMLSIYSSWQDFQRGLETSSGSCALFSGKKRGAYFCNKSKISQSINSSGNGGWLAW